MPDDHAHKLALLVAGAKLREQLVARMKVREGDDLAAGIEALNEWDKAVKDYTEGK